jgi:hypothetical protein
MKTENEILEWYTPEELLRGMMRSLYCYDKFPPSKEDYNKYIEEYIIQLGKDEFDRIYKDQEQFLYKHEIVRNVFTDEDGITYNDLKLKNQ